MSFFQKITDFFEYLFNRNSPEVQKKIQAKKIESEINPYRKWSYKTNSPIVAMLYESLTKNYEAVKALPDEWCTDILPTVVKFYFEDGHVDLVETYDLSAAEDFLICVRRLVPETEYMPVCIATAEDYEEDDENDDQS